MNEPTMSPGHIRRHDIGTATGRLGSSLFTLIIGAEDIANSLIVAILARGPELESTLEAIDAASMAVRPDSLTKDNAVLAVALYTVGALTSAGLSFQLDELPELARLEGEERSLPDPTHTRRLPGGRAEIRRTAMPSSDRVFISHAAADRQLADLLRDTLILGGVPEGQLFYSSSRGSGIASGCDIRSDLHEQLHKAGLIIELISPVYLLRPMCLIEHGAAWALGKPTYPIVVPPLERDNVEQQVGSIHMGLLGTEEDLDDVLDELHDRLASDVGVNTRAASWNRATRHFKRHLADSLTVIN